VNIDFFGNIKNPRLFF